MSDYVPGEDERNRYGYTIREILMGHVVIQGECWVMNKALTDKGYAQIMFKQKWYSAHRLSYILNVGPVSNGLVVDHLCRNRACVNPAHLEPVTTHENNLRGIGVTATNSAKQFCPEGHPYDAENTYERNGKRYCRECGRTRSRDRQRRIHADRIESGDGQ